MQKCSNYDTKLCVLYRLKKKYYDDFVNKKIKVSTNNYMFIYMIIKVIFLNFIIEFRGSIMKIAVICANGRIGSLIVDEIIARGLEVTAIARSKNKTIAKKFYTKGFI